MLETLQQNPVVAKLIHHIPPGQFGRYLVVGLWNTVFGYGLYAGLTALLTPHVPHAYILASVLGNLVAITVAFLGYKWFIFKTKGNYLREWMRCVAVYSGGIVLGIVLLPVFVYTLRHTTRFDVSAPYIAGAVLMGFTVIISFLGHKNYSFAGSGE